jgi:hypothetical protein
MIQKLRSFLETVDYSCDATFVDLTDLSFAINSKARENLNTNSEGISNIEQIQEDETVKDLFKDIFVNAKLSCQQEIERSYYSAKCFTVICFNCGIADIEIPSSNDTYPYCNECEMGPGFKQKRGKGLKFGGEEHQKKKAKKS